VLLQGNIDPLDAALNRLRRTRRPERAEMGALLTEVKALPVTVAEEALLESALAKFDRWAVSAQ
jgi:hypothetical protein